MSKLTGQNVVAISMKAVLIAAVLMSASLASAQAIDTATGDTADADGAQVSLNEAVVTRQVENRVAGPSEGPYEADGERLYVFLNINNPTDVTVTYTLLWQNLTTDYSFDQTLDAGHSSGWRTWGYHRLRPSQAGNWRVSVVDPAGETVQTLQFDVVAPIESASPAVAEVD